MLSGATYRTPAVTPYHHAPRHYQRGAADQFTYYYGYATPTSYNEDRVAHRDLYRYANQYFAGDYRPIGGGSLSPLDDVLPPDYELFNGNIVRHYQATATDGWRTAGLVGEYDQLNRLRSGTNAFYGQDPAAAATTPTALSEAREAPVYDGNGNIRLLDRSYTTTDGRALTNRLSYGYARGTNLLTRVEARVSEAAGGGTPGPDSWQPFDLLWGSHTYAYDGSGNLVEETQSGQEPTTMDWNAYGKVTTVSSSAGQTSFGYGPDQQRWRKSFTPDLEQEARSTYYVRDAQGNTLATYTKEGGAAGGNLVWQQQYLYGSARLGEVVFDRALTVSTTQPQPARFGERRYELTNHLGNVTTVLGAYPSGQVLAGETDPSYSAPGVVSYRDYLAFGLGLRRGAGLGESSYRYAFNGKEVDDEGEWGTTGSNQANTHYDYGFRIYNPGIARFLSVDPLMSQYPMLTPYQYASNRPIDGIDLDGLEYLTYVVNWYDNMESPVISVSHYNPNQHNEHGPQGRGLKYVVNYWETKANGLPQLNTGRSKEFFYARDAPYTEYGLYYGATGLYKLTKEGELDQGIYDYAIPPVDYVDYGAWVHDKGYDAVGAAGASGLLGDVATIPADVQAIETWQEVVDLGVGGVDPHNGQPISQEEFNAASRGVALFKSLVFGDKARAVTNLLEKNIFRRMADYASGRALRENVERFINLYFVKNEDGHYVKREGYWESDDSSDGYGDPISLDKVDRPRP